MRKGLFAEREHREKVALLELSGEGIYGVDLQGRCTFINRSGARMLGYKTEELVGKNMHALMHHSRPDGSPYPQEECPIYRAFQLGQGCRLENEVLWRRDGTRFAAEYSAHPILEDGAIRGAVVTFDDISKRKQADLRLSVPYTISRVLAKAPDFGSAAPQILRAIGEALAKPRHQAAPARTNEEA
jgi:PAS domain S-box-containing protein